MLSCSPTDTESINRVLIWHRCFLVWLRTTLSPLHGKCESKYTPSSWDRMARNNARDFTAQLREPASCRTLVVQSTSYYHILQLFACAPQRSERPGLNWESWLWCLRLGVIKGTRAPSQRYRDASPRRAAPPGPALLRAASVSTLSAFTLVCSNQQLRLLTNNKDVLTSSRAHGASDGREKNRDTPIATLIYIQAIFQIVPYINLYFMRHTFKTIIRNSDCPRMHNWFTDDRKQPSTFTDFQEWMLDHPLQPILILQLLNKHFLLQDSP